MKISCRCWPCRIVAGLGLGQLIGSRTIILESLLWISHHLNQVQRNLHKYIDVLNLNENYFETIRLEDIVSKLPSWYQRMIIEHDREAEELLREKGIEKDIIFTTCDSIINNEEIVTTLREILSTIHDHYNYPVDVEFTINFSQDGDFLINLVQCRPLQAKGSGAQDVSIPTVSEDKTFFHLKRGTMEACKHAY